MIYDVIVVGAGPAGSSSAHFLARRGTRVLLLDQDRFPREKVCGDGITPQALHWIKRLGCFDEVISRTQSRITSCDLIISGRHILTADIPENTEYPPYSIVLKRSILDTLLLEKALECGATFRPECRVTALENMRDCVKVTAAYKGRDLHFRGRLVIGADGVSSTVSRIIGNDMQDGLTAVAVRAYYSGVPKRKSGMKIFFSRRCFPGYGWLFRGDDGTANIGVACLTDRMFRLKRDIRNLFDDFVNVDLAGLLGRATLTGRVAGGAARFSRPGKIVSDRVMLAGDAGNMIDPLSGAGIHRAMESAFWASETAVRALDEGVCTADFLRMYERLWKQNRELDWRIGEFLLTVAKNPHTRELSLLALEHVGRLCARDRKFREFCAGVFAGFVPQSTGLSPLKLLQVLPRSWDVWESYLEHSLREGKEWVQQLFGGSGSIELPMRFVSRPLENISWGLDVATKIVRLADCYLCTHRSS